MLSGDGRCRAFDAGAKGYGRADGCVAMLLEKMPNGDEGFDRVPPHWAVIEVNKIICKYRFVGIE
jgi:acyl transferase domain-containing protein